MKRLLITFFILTGILLSQPKHEFRAAWIATVYNIDWPSSTSPASQKSQLIRILDEMEAANMNAAVLQVRPACDVFYDSEIEPWSNWLTGTEGQAPDPYYDPLEFAIQEAHKRNIELHAWFNPYRAKKGAKNGITEEHVFNKHPDWILGVDSQSNDGLSKYNYYGMESMIGAPQTATDYILNPGLPQVRDYVVSVIMEVVNNYDVDGVHMDDYFYPYSGISNEDQNTFSEYDRGFTDIGDWRRDNINLLIEAMHDSIKAVKPHVKFGMSPFGIWKSGIPAGIYGLDAYSTLYCDARAWLRGNYIDYLAPQLYWPFGGSTDYKKLMPWWAEQSGKYGRHLYTGNGAYRINDWSAGEMPRQLRYNRIKDHCLGNIYYNVSSLLNNPKGFLDSLKNNYYQYSALTPPMPWLDSIPPHSPQNLQFSQNDGSFIMTWDSPEMAADGDSAYRYIIYKNVNFMGDLRNPENIAAMVSGRVDSIALDATSDGHYAITAVDRMSNESEPLYTGDVAVEKVDVAEEFQLLDNYPNPFNPATTIPFVLDRSAAVDLIIYDLLGQEVAVLLDNKNMTGGHHEINFDASHLPTGIYFYKISTGEKQQIKRMLLIK